MSLFSSIQLANNTLRAQQVGLQVAGQNIANANTPGYIREELVVEAGPTQRLGNLLLGSGVQITGVIQKVDRFLEHRLRAATSDRSNAEVEEQAYLELENLLAELSDNDLSTSLNGFFGSISDILNQPENVSVRNMAVLKGQKVADDINRLAAGVDEVRTSLNERVADAAGSINRLLDEIHALNVQIAQFGGDVNPSDAVGLSDQRSGALAQLAELVDVRAVEQPNGAVAIFSGGEFLLLDDAQRIVEVAYTLDDGFSIANLRLAETEAPLGASGGQVAGLVAARDETLGGFLDQLDRFAATLIFEFNKVFSSGQGLTGYDELTSAAPVASSSAALDAAGLSFTPVNGSFQVQVTNEQTGVTQTTDVRIDLNGLDGDTTLDSLAAALEAIDGLTASVSDGRLTIAAESPDSRFAFAADTSGALAALGINAFFAGDSARSICVDETFLDDPSKFAASRGGVGADTSLAVDLAAFIDRPLAGEDQSLAALYERITATVTQGSAVARSVAEGTRVFEESLHGQHLAISGVSIDEEVVRMMQYQRVFQASAKYIATLSELLGLLVNL